MTNVFFNYSAIVLLFCLAIVALEKTRKTKSKSTVLFLATLFVNIFSALSSSLDLYFDNLGPGNLLAKYITHTSYLIFHNWSIVCYFFYILCITDTWEDFFKITVKNCILMIPILITTVILLINPFKPIVFYFDELDRYTRIWPNFMFLYIIAGFYATYSFTYTILHRKLYKPGQFVTALLIYPIIIISVILELIITGIAVESFFDSIALLFICMNIQGAEETISAETGFLNSYAYTWDIKKVLYNKKHITQILVNITNFDTVQNIIGFNNKQDFLSLISNTILEAERQAGLRTRNYYLENGNFSLVFNSSNDEKINSLAQIINNIFTLPLNFKDVAVNLVTNVCIEKNPEDIIDFDTIFIFEKELSNPKYYSGQILYAKNIYNSDYYQKLQNIDQILENALANNNFKVYFQPIYSIKKKRFTSAEALLRLFDNEFGSISPDFFIPAAERNGLIFKITDYVLEEVSKFISSPEFKELEIEYIEINLSAAECMQDNLSERINSILKKYEIDNSKINIEITETALSLSEEKLYENMKELVSTGVTISLDDFGSGYSNLQRLTYLPLNIVKFDKSFIHNIKDANIKNIMLNNMGEMIHQMGIKFLIEGVETFEILKYFESLNCDYVQGYYFSKPISKEDFVSFIKNSQRGIN